MKLINYLALMKRYIKLDLLIILFLILASCTDYNKRTDVYVLHNATNMNMVLNVRLNVRYDKIDAIIYDTIFLNSGQHYVFLMKESLSPNVSRFYYKALYNFDYIKMDSMFVVVDSVVVKEYGIGGGKTPLIESFYIEEENLDTDKEKSYSHIYTFLPEDFE